MASIVMMIGGALVNALAFTGGNYLFSMFDKSGALAESKRHNAALEKLSQEQASFNIKRAENLDWLNAQNARKQKAVNEVYSVNSAFNEYKKLYGAEPSLPHPNLKNPELEYTPSNEQKNYELLVAGAGAAATVVTAVNLIK